MKGLGEGVIAIEQGFGLLGGVLGGGAGPVEALAHIVKRLARGGGFCLKITKRALNRVSGSGQHICAIRQPRKARKGIEDALRNLVRGFARCCGQIFDEGCERASLGKEVAPCAFQGVHVLRGDFGACVYAVHHVLSRCDGFADGGTGAGGDDAIGHVGDILINNLSIILKLICKRGKIKVEHAAKLLKHYRVDFFAIQHGGCCFLVQKIIKKCEISSLVLFQCFQISLPVIPTMFDSLLGLVFINSIFFISPGVQLFPCLVIILCGLYKIGNCISCFFPVNRKF